MTENVVQMEYCYVSARILRAIRVAARLDFSFSRETAHSIVDLAHSVLQLDKVLCINLQLLTVFFGCVCLILWDFDNYLLTFCSFSQGRLLMEINYMFAYGSAQASLRMLWRFGLLELLLPIQVGFSYLLCSQVFKIHLVSICIALFRLLDVTAPHRQHILLLKVSVGGIRELICYW